MSNPEFDDLRRQFATVLRASAASLRSAAIAVEQYANIIETGGIPSSHDIRQISSQLPQIPMLMGLGNMMGMGFASGQEGQSSGKAEGKKKKGAAGDSMMMDNISPVGEDGDTKKRKRGPKKPRDPNAPKRPPSAYLIFQNEVRREIKEKNPDMTNTEVLGEVAKLWGQLTAEEKKPYNDATELAKMEYERAKAEYEANQGGAAGAAATGHADHDSDESDEDATKAILLPVEQPSKVKVVSKDGPSKEKEKKKKEEKKKEDKKEKERSKKEKARPSAVSVASKVVAGTSTEDSDEEDEDPIFKGRQSTAAKKKVATSDSEEGPGSDEESEEEPPRKRAKASKEEAPPVISSKKDKAKKK